VFGERHHRLYNAQNLLLFLEKVSSCGGTNSLAEDRLKGSARAAYQ